RGGGDDRFDQQSATVTEDSGGDRPPRLKVDTSGNNGFVNWGGLGVTAEHAASVSVTLPSYPSSNVQFMVPLGSEGAKAWQLSIQSSGVMRLVSPSNATLATGSTSLPLNERLRVEIRSDGTNISASAYDSTGSLVETIAASSTLGDLYNFRVGS